MMKSILSLKSISQDTPAKIYYAGECARDIIRRQKPQKIEVVILNLSFQKILNYIKKQFDNIQILKNKKSIKFIDDNREVIISLPCKNGKYNSSFSLKDDSENRIFTINAMYLPIRSKNRGDIIDFFNGRNDIKNRRIRTIENPDYIIKKNPYILIKSIALAAKLNYRIDSALFHAIKNNAKLISNIKIKEIRESFTQIVLSSKPSRYLKLMYNANLLAELIPELVACNGLHQNKKYHKYDVFMHCLVACDNTHPDLALRLAALFHDIGKSVTYKKLTDANGKVKGTFYNHEVAGSKIVKQILRRFRYDKELIKTVSDLVYNHMYNYEPDLWTDAAVRRFIKKTHITDKDLEDLDNFTLFLLRKADRAANGLGLSPISYRQKKFQERIRQVYNKSKVLHVNDLAINGDDIMNYFRLTEGPTIGHILNYLLGLVIEDQSLNTKEKLLDEARKYLSEALT